MKKCLGCGEILQDQNEDELGYVVSLDMDYCKRCFRMRHYDAHIAKDFMPDNDEILEELAGLNGDYIWIIDIFDLDTSLNSRFGQFYQEHDCSIILNKCDLLPESVNYQHLADYVLKRIGKLQIRSKAIITRGVNDDFVEVFNQYIRKDQPLIFTGVANVGKSTIINQLLGQELVTVNRYPATTIRVNEIQTDEYHIFDTAGLWIKDSVMAHLSSKDLKVAIPTRQIRPTVFQVSESQSYAIGGLARIDIYNNHKNTLVFYCSNQLEIHRGKKEKADAYWQNHYGSMKPALQDCKSIDDFKKVSFIHQGKAEYFITGLGFVSVVGGKCNIDVYVGKDIQVYKREAMM